MLFKKLVLILIVTSLSVSCSHFKISRKAEDPLWCPEIGLTGKWVKIQREDIPPEWSAFKGFTGDLLAKYNGLGLSYETLYQCWEREQVKRAK